MSNTTDDLSRWSSLFEHPRETPVIFLGQFPGNRKLYLKRVDLIHESVSGNKWFKLKYNFKHALEQGAARILTFGGAYSNHIYATAAAGHYCGIPTIGVIRGELSNPLNPTLQQARAWGMQLKTLSRTLYRRKYDPDIIQFLKEQFGDFYMIPEGGSNQLAIQGCAEIITGSQYHYVCISCGTGGTLAGLATGLSAPTQLIGFPAIKGGELLENDIKNWLKRVKGEICSWRLVLDYHFGGYARFNQDLISFINGFKTRYGIQLDPIYTGKLMFGVMDSIKKGMFDNDTNILVLHSGGLQGIKGIQEKYGKNVI